MKTWLALAVKKGMFLEPRWLMIPRLERSEIPMSDFENGNPEFPEADPSEESNAEAAMPLITYSIIAVCCAIFAYMELGTRHVHYSTFFEFISPYEPEIWSGAVWALATTVLVHGDMIHLLFNMWWTKDFGRILEPTMGPDRFLLFILGAAIVSSGIQLAVSSVIGIGFSGVVYAMFGYALAARSSVSAYREMTNRSTTQLLLGWMIFCIPISYLNLMNVGNSAHVSGFAFGYCVAILTVVKSRRVFSRVVLAILIALTVLSVSYMPWSDDWNGRNELTDWWAMIDAADAGDAESQYQYGSALLYEDESKSLGVEWLLSAAEQGHTQAMNALAWFLATDPNPAFRNGKQALTWGLKACEMEEWADPMTIDTLAAAYAELERWDDALKTQELAISKLTKPTKAELADYESRRQMYQRREQYREQPAKIQ